jgi:hypothetical protein
MTMWGPFWNSGNLLPLHRDDVVATERTPLLTEETRQPAGPASASATNAVQATSVAARDVDETSQADASTTDEERSPVSTLERIKPRFGTEFNREQAWLQAGKITTLLLEATKKSGAFAVRQLINGKSVSLVLPLLMEGPSSKNLTASLGRLAVDEGFKILSGDSDNTVINKGISKALDFHKYHEFVFSFAEVFVNAKLTLKDKVQKMADAIWEEEKLDEFVQQHPEAEASLMQLKEAINAYSPPAEQKLPDADINGVLLAMIMMRCNPRLSKESLKTADMARTPETRDLFSKAANSVQELARKCEVEKTADIGIFHKRWRNLGLADEMPFMLLSGEGATGFARAWCDKVKEVPIEIDADDLVEIMTGTRHKDAKPRVPERDPSPLKRLGGFYSRMVSESAISPIVVTGFDPRRADHAGLVPLLQGECETEGKIDIPYKNIFFDFNLKGVPVLLCADAFATDKKTGASAEAKTESEGSVLPDVTLRAHFPVPSEQRRRQKFDEAMHGTVAQYLDRIAQDDESDIAAQKKQLTKETVSQDVYRDLFVARSMEKNVSLKQAEEALQDFAAHVFYSNMPAAEKEFKTFLDDYFDHFGKRGTPPSLPADKDSKDASWLDALDRDQLAEDYAKPLRAQRTSLEKGQTAIDRYFKPKPKPKQAVLPPLLATALDLLATYKEKVGEARQQIENAGKLNETDEQGNTALHYAVQIPKKKRGEIVRTLLEADIDIDCRNKDGKSAADVALGRNDFETIGLILKDAERRAKKELAGSSQDAP